MGLAVKGLNTYNGRNIFRNLSNIYCGSFLRKAPVKMFYRVLNATLLGASLSRTVEYFVNELKLILSKSHQSKRNTLI